MLVKASNRHAGADKRAAGLFFFLLGFRHLFTMTSYGRLSASLAFSH